MRVQQFRRKNSREQKSSAAVLSAFGQEGNIFIICCSTGKFLFGFLEANLFLASFTDKLPGAGGEPAGRLSFTLKKMTL
jgi:hypothetical protein